MCIIYIIDIYKQKLTKHMYIYQRKIEDEAWAWGLDIRNLEYLEMLQSTEALDLLEYIKYTQIFFINPPGQ